MDFNHKSDWYERIEVSDEIGMCQASMTKTGCTMTTISLFLKGQSEDDLWLSIRSIWTNLLES